MRGAWALAPVLVMAAACGEGTTDDGASSETTLTVLAASSLTETFTELEKDFEADHDGVDVRISFDSSSTLAQQAIEGAPADVLATADEATMAMATDGGTATDSQLFATNTMVMVVPASNPSRIERFADLDDDSVDYVACEQSAPCGAHAKTLLEVNDISAQPVSFEVDVKAVLTKVELDEADAGLVYQSDAVASGDMVKTLEIPKADAEINNYPIATLRQRESPALARQWVDLVLSEEGQDVLDAAGFGAP